MTTTVQPRPQLTPVYANPVQAAADLSPASLAIFPDLDPSQTGDLAPLYAAARSHPAVFADNFAVIFDPTTNRSFRFVLWDWQWRLLSLFTQEKRIVILKARQLGVSWLLAVYVLWKALFFPNTNVILISRTEGVASDLLGKCQYIYHRLPPQLRPKRHRNDRDNSVELSWASINSAIKAVASTREAGRSESATIAVPDEWADHPFAGEMYVSYDGTVGTEGQIIGCSTAKGRQGLFYRIYQGAKRGRQNAFCPVFLPADLRPDYTPDFLSSKRAQYELAGEPWKYQQEYAQEENTAWGGSLNTFFAQEHLSRLSAACRPPLWVPAESPWQHALRVWERPRAGMRYTIGADPADNTLDGSQSAAWVLQSVTGRHVATLRGHWPPYQFADLLHQLGQMYAADPAVRESYAVIAVERNNHGLAVLESLRNVWDYQNLYRSKDAKHSWADGWRTNTATRPVMFEELRRAVSDESFYTEDEEWCEEASSFTEDSHGRPQGEGDARDDLICASAIGWMARHHHPTVRGTRRTAPLAR